MRKIILFLLMVCFSITQAIADPLSKTINSLNINKSAISVSIKDVENGNSIYTLNDKAPMIPASTLKLVTSSAAADCLGKDYKFSTKLYKSTNNDLYLVLGADPFLVSGDLSQLFETARNKNIIEPKNIYIDDSIFDNVEWGEGWQWDDDLNPLMPKFSAYNLDDNMLKIEVIPNVNNTPASIVVKPFYPLTFMNLVNTDIASANNVKLNRNNTISPNILNVSGTISKTQTFKIPVNNQKRYFTLRLEDVIHSKKLEYASGIKNAQLPEENIYLVDEVNHDISQALQVIIKNSNNLVAETLFKLAGAVYSNGQGNIDNSLSMLKQYQQTNGLLSDDIKIVDGSGVSKNNIMTADYMTKFLVFKAKSDDFETFKTYLPTAGEGTLKTRMLYFKDNLRAKTGTLSGASAIAGYITSRKGKVYAFDIMINDAKTLPADKKNIEEQILRQIYVNY